MAALVQDFDHPARDPQIALDRLIRVRIHAERDRLRLIRRLGQFALQQFARVDLRVNATFEIETRREAEIAVRRPREAINAAPVYTSRTLFTFSETCLQI